ncbi:IS3 family transposase [Plebeiibacterium sediminum]|uniref:IS3 family transposase n=1 Tax=Plebeiibacterium sediminum TaxID=2992112 RepID=A0AAE3MA35_9BACT|nr:IS3 family transposase [Plebeiobacterium sediminum]MCW3789747.1 IS3 family transposase [Plebeiobacterium sediminum]
MKVLRELVDPQSKLSISAQCALMDISRSGLYYNTKGESEENLEIMRLLDSFFMDHPTYGVFQMQDLLADSGYAVNVKRVRRLLRKMGIMAIYPQRNLSKMLHAEYVHPYLLRNLEINSINQVWEIDITYIPMAKGFMYLTAIIDVYSRFVVGWGLSNTLDAEASIKVLKEAIITHGKPHIVNSDQGCQFTCHKWVNLLKEEGIRISMDGKGRALDNIYIERLWRTVKRDYVYLNPADDGWELYQGLKDFFEHYNYRKCHQGIGRKKPFEIFINQMAAA